MGTSTCEAYNYKHQAPCTECAIARFTFTRPMNFGGADGELKCTWNFCRGHAVACARWLKNPPAFRAEVLHPLTQEVPQN